VLIIPDDDEFVANVTGALETLTIPSYWQKHGALTPEQAAGALVDMFDGFCFKQGVCRMIGELIAYASPISPDAKFLACNGASLLRSSYPDLFAVIGVVYGSVDSLHFNVPDGQGRALVGSGSGSGLTVRSDGDTFGEETHTLVGSEAPRHTHTDLGHVHGEGIAVPTAILVGVGAPVPSAIPGIGVTGSGNASLNDAGLDQPHNNMQPSFVASWYIVALP
jgi:microcystin-dependent protein